LSLVVDASVAVAWCIQDESTRDAWGVLAKVVESGGVVPSIWPLEMGNALLVAERRKRLTPADTTRLVGILNAFPIRVDDHAARCVNLDVIESARAFGLSAYDGAYLELAVREALPLATFDLALRKAAKKLGVSLVLR